MQSRTLYIVILSTLTIFTFLAAHNLMSLFMGVFFIAIALLKFIDLKGFAYAFAQYDLLAKKTIIYGYLYPFIEIALGLSYLSLNDPVIPALITFLLLGIGIVGVAISLREQKEIHCACFGTLVKVPLSEFTLFEDTYMLIMALMLIFA